MYLVSTWLVSIYGDVVVTSAAESVSALEIKTEYEKAYGQKFDT